MNNVLIIGFGQIGESISRLYFKNKYNIDYIDVNKGKLSTTLQSVDVMHICIPCTNKDSFLATVKSYILTYHPSLTIINSSIPVGTTRLVSETVGEAYDIVYSPVMGVHPYLTESLRTFKKIVAGPSRAIQKATKHFAKVDVIVEVYDSYEDAEIAKLLDTTYYGHVIAYMQEVYKICEQNNLNFNQVYTKTNQIYNDGYSKMGRREVVRPILKFMDYGIGKHCVYENAILLDELGFKEIAEPILKIGKPKKDE